MKLSKLSAFAITLLVLAWPLQARDLDGRYTDNKYHDWFNTLKSSKGYCCSDADGSAVSDADWEAQNKPASHFRVRVPSGRDKSSNTIWVDVPDETVITEPNLVGRTMVWPLYGTDGVTIRCFMLGPLG